MRDNDENSRARAAADEIDMEIDTSSLQAAPAEEVTEEDIDFIYGEDDNYDYSGSLDEISADSIVLDDMDANVKIEEMRTSRSAEVSSLKSSMQADDLALSYENRPKLDDMSDEYAPTQRNSADLARKETLDKDEKELIRTRLKTEIESKPEGYDKKKSYAMYKKLMDEQKAKAAKRGFVQLLITAALGLISAVAVYFIKPNADGLHPILDYLPVGALAFSLLMLLKSKFFKIMSVLFFAADAVMLIYPGLVGYALNADNQTVGTDFLVKLALYVAGFVLCAAVVIRLVTNKDIEEYYIYKPSKGGGRR